jgi:hypothetical protein
MQRVQVAAMQQGQHKPAMRRFTPVLALALALAAAAAALVAAGN